MLGFSFSLLTVWGASTVDGREWPEGNGRGREGRKGREMAPPFHLVSFKVFELWLSLLLCDRKHCKFEIEARWGVPGK